MNVTVYTRHNPQGLLLGRDESMANGEHAAAAECIRTVRFCSFRVQGVEMGRALRSCFLLTCIEHPIIVIDTRIALQRPVFVNIHSIDHNRYCIRRSYLQNMDNCGRLFIIHD